MTEPIQENGFLVIESENGGLSGPATFCQTMDEAQSLARDVVQNDALHFPVVVVPITRFTTERIEQMRGNRR